MRPTPPLVDSCHLVAPAVPGAEDIVIDRETGTAYISADDRRDPLDRRERGAIYAYDTGQPQAQPVDLAPSLPAAFHPHGIGLYTGPGGERRLFVVNHGDAAGSVEIFGVEGGALRHLEQVRESTGLLHSANDVVPVGPRSFYVTSLFGSRSRAGRLGEVLGLRRRSYVLHYDGARWHRAAEGIGMANGIAASADGQLLFVAASAGREIRPFRRERDGGLAPLTPLRLGAAADNIDVDEDGDLWIAAHPSPGRLALHMAGLTTRAPSRVLRVPFRSGALGEPQLVMDDDGRRISAASVAARHRDTLLVGSVYGGFLTCSLR